MLVPDRRFRRGIGFDEMSIVPGRGLYNLPQRACALGGTVEIRSSRGAGTSVTLRLPFTGAGRS
jgi:signal transduction histidine kinase